MQCYAVCGEHLCGSRICWCFSFEELFFFLQHSSAFCYLTMTCSSSSMLTRTISSLLNDILQYNPESVYCVCGCQLFSQINVRNSKHFSQRPRKWRKTENSTKPTTRNGGNQCCITTWGCLSGQSFLAFIMRLPVRPVVLGFYHEAGCWHLSCTWIRNFSKIEQSTAKLSVFNYIQCADIVVI